LAKAPTPTAAARLTITQLDERKPGRCPPQPGLGDPG
jgi:hypothetical protein